MAVGFWQVFSLLLASSILSCTMVIAPSRKRWSLESLDNYNCWHIAIRTIVKTSLTCAALPQKVDEDNSRGILIRCDASVVIQTC